MPKDFRESVTLELLMERVVPPFRPPGASLAKTILFTTVFVAFIGLVVVLAAPSGSAVGVILAIIIGLVAIGVAVTVHRWLAAKDAVYRALHGQTKDRAWRMLSGKGSLKWGDTRERLEADAAKLVKMQKPMPSGTTWVFIWWESEG